MVNAGEMVFGAFFNIMGSLVFLKRRFCYDLGDQKNGPSGVEESNCEDSGVGFGP